MKPITQILLVRAPAADGATDQFKRPAPPEITEGLCQPEEMAFIFEHAAFVHTFTNHSSGTATYTERVTLGLL